MRRLWLLSLSLFVLFLAACGSDLALKPHEDLAVQACWRPTLRQGDSGEHVKYAQQRLLTKGDPYAAGTPAYYIRSSGGADGAFGSGTYKAVVAFQKMSALQQDGIIGPNTWDKLGCGTAPSRVTLAGQILSTSRITLWSYSPITSSSSDGADAKSNIRDTANGKAAKRSSYGNAPGGTVYLNTSMLSGMLRASSSYSFRVTSIAGGSHSVGSRHYAGLAFDTDYISGKSVSARGLDSTVKAFMQLCRNNGATEVLGPGNAGHSGHVHCAW